MAKRQNKAILIVALVLVIAAMAMVVVSAVMATKVAEDSGGGGFVSGGYQDPGSSSGTPTIPASSLSYNSWVFDETQFQMAGHSFRDYNDSCGIRFSVNVPYSIKKEMEEKEGTDLFKLCAIIVPASYFEEIEAECQEGEQIDWYQKLKDQNKKMLHLEQTDPDNVLPYVIGGKNVYLAHFSIANIKPENVNRKFTCIFYIQRYADANATEGVREYATYPEGQTYKSFARSYAWICGEALNDWALGSPTHSKQETLDHLFTVMDYACDLANGVETPSADGSTVSFQFHASSVELELDQGAVLTYTMTPELHIPIRWHSQDRSVVSVDDTGTIRSVGYGKTYVVATVAGVNHYFTVTVTGPLEEIVALFQEEYSKNFALMTGTAPDGSIVQLTYQDLSLRASQFMNEVWNEEDYSITLLNILGDATHLGTKDQPGQDIEYSMELKVLSYGARAALADLSTEQGNGYSWEFEFAGHTF